MFFRPDLTWRCLLIILHRQLYAEERQKNLDIETICALLDLVLGVKFPSQVDHLTQYLMVSSPFMVLIFSDYILEV